jgi:hypothetical protein
LVLFCSVVVVVVDGIIIIVVVVSGGVYLYVVYLTMLPLAHSLASDDKISKE